MAKRTMSTKWLISLFVAILLCCAVFVVSTYSLLSDSKTATGTVTFNLADYDLYITNTSSVTGNIAPGHSGTTEKIQLINSYAADSLFGDATDGGTTAAMGGVYIKLTDIAIKVGNTSIGLSSFAKTDVGVKIATKSGMTVTLKSSAGTNMYWFYEGSNIYLSSSGTSISKSTLAFSEKDETKTVANIQFQVDIADPGTEGGFNATTAGSNVIDNDYQGDTISISYTIKWATSTTELD